MEVLYPGSIILGIVIILFLGGLGSLSRLRLHVLMVRIFVLAVSIANWLASLVALLHTPGEKGPWPKAVRNSSEDCLN